MSSIGSIIQEVGSLSFAKIWRVVSKPSLFPALLKAPVSVSYVDAILLLFPGLPRETVEACRLEYLRDHKFFEEVNKKFVEIRHRRTPLGRWSELLYMAIKFARPKVVFETGVFDGHSSAVMLRALHENGDGVLAAVDLPATETIEGATNRMVDSMLPPNCQPGWIVPDYLRKNYHLHLGDSKELLPKLFKEYPQIDVFFHDSLHTFQHQYFEYSTAWPYLSEGGLLLSHDIFWSSAFHRFCKEKGKKYVRTGSDFGSVRK